MKTKTKTKTKTGVTPFAKLNRVRLTFYRECMKEGLAPEDITAIGYAVSELDSPKDVLAGIKASRQRKLNLAGRKAARTRKKNSRAMARAMA